MGKAQGGCPAARVVCQRAGQAAGQLRGPQSVACCAAPMRPRQAPHNCLGSGGARPPGTAQPPAERDMAKRGRAAAPPVPRKRARRASPQRQDVGIRVGHRRVVLLPGTGRRRGAGWGPPLCTRGKCGAARGAPRARDFGRGAARTAVSPRWPVAGEQLTAAVIMPKSRGSHGGWPEGRRGGPLADVKGKVKSRAHHAVWFILTLRPVAPALPGQLATRAVACTVSPATRRATPWRLPGHPPHGPRGGPQRHGRPRPGSALH